MKLYNRHATVESVETPGLKRDVEIRRTAMLDLTPPEINRVVDTLKVAIWRVDIFFGKQQIFLQPLAEQWSDVALQFTSIYGIRRYFNNSALISHVDRWAETAELVPRATCPGHPHTSSPPSSTSARTWRRTGRSSYATTGARTTW